MKYWKYNNWIIDEGETFIYRVELHVQQDRRYWLESTKFYGSKVPIEGILEEQIIQYNTFTLIKSIELSEAPIEWLERNATQIEVLTKKEKKKKKDESINNKQNTNP